MMRRKESMKPARVFMAERFAGALAELWFLSKALPKSSDWHFLEAIAIGIH
jgi:hypothetical protein